LLAVARAAADIKNLQDEKLYTNLSNRMQRNTVKMTYNRLENLSEKKSELRKEIKRLELNLKMMKQIIL
jgi:hypothetical protein